MRKKGGPGVYIIQNKVNNKVYIGASRDVYNRLCMHKWKLRINTHHNLHLQSAFNKYGEDNFVFDTLEDCKEEFIFSQENYWCNMLNSHNKVYGYNIDPTSPIGKIAVSEETKDRMSMGAEKRPIVAYTIYGQFCKEFSDFYKCAAEFETVAPNIHRKMNNVMPKKFLIDSKSSRYIFTDKDFCIKHVQEHWNNIVNKIKNDCSGPYKVFDCFDNFVGTATLKQLSIVLNIGLSSLCQSIKRGTNVKTFKIVA